MTISLDKQYKTRDGREVKLFMVDGGGELPVLGAVKNPHGWDTRQWYPNGRINFFCLEKGDLIEIKPRIKLERWVNVYRDGNSILYHKKDEADRLSDPCRIACVKITIDCEEGEGLS